MVSKTKNDSATTSAAQARRLIDLGACVDFLDRTGQLTRVKT